MAGEITYRKSIPSDAAGIKALHDSFRGRGEISIDEIQKLIRDNKSVTAIDSEGNVVGYLAGEKSGKSIIANSGVLDSTTSHELYLVFIENH